LQETAANSKALICDVMHLVSGNAVWQTVATYCVAGGIVGAILAAVPGLIDYLSINEVEMKRIANFHLAVNLGAVLIFAINLWLRFLCRWTAVCRLCCQSSECSALA